MIQYNVDFSSPVILPLLALFVIAPFSYTNVIGHDFSLLFSVLLFVPRILVFLFKIKS